MRREDNPVVKNIATAMAETNEEVMSDLPKSELAIKRDEWFVSEEGRKCNDPFTLKTSRTKWQKHLMRHRRWS